MLTVNLIILIVVISFFVYHHRRTKLYALSNKLNGPMSLPIIGSAYHFIGSKSDGKKKIFIKKDD